MTYATECKHKTSTHHFVFWALGVNVRTKRREAVYKCAFCDWKIGMPAHRGFKFKDFDASKLDKGPDHFTPVGGIG